MTHPTTLSITQLRLFWLPRGTSRGDIRGVTTASCFLWPLTTLPYLMHWESLMFSRHVQLKGDLEIDPEQHLWNYMSPLASEVVMQYVGGEMDMLTTFLPAATGIRPWSSGRKWIKGWMCVVQNEIQNTFMVSSSWKSLLINENHKRCKKTVFI